MGAFTQTGWKAAWLSPKGTGTDFSFGNAWDWVRDRIPHLDPASNDPAAGGGILGPLNGADHAAQGGDATSPPPAPSPAVYQPDTGVNLGTARFNDPHPTRAPNAWPDDNGKTVYILRPDHSLEIRQGGTLAWRNNNPGNLARSRSAEIGHNDSLGKDDTIQQFAIFENPESGKASLNRLLLGRDYANLSISDAMYQYAPPKKNNTEAYISNITRRTGLDRSTVLNAFTDAQRAAYVGAIRAHEDSRPGTSRLAIYNAWGDWGASRMRVGLALVAVTITTLVMCNSAIADGPARKSDNVRTCKNLTVGRFQPDSMISGKLVRRMVWGPPNYGEDPKTDAQYHAWFVVLDDPINVMTGPDIGDPPELTIAREIQIRWASRDEDGYFRYSGRHVVVRGRLFTQVFPGDHTPVVIEASALGSGPAIHCRH